MPLYNPVFAIVKRGDQLILRHNCDGGLGFVAEKEIDEPTANIINLAIEAGKRRKAAELREALFIGA